MNEGGHSPPYILAPPEVTLVAESGLRTRGDLEPLMEAGIRAFLIGETLVTAPDPGAKLREFVGGRAGLCARHQIIFRPGIIGT